MNLELKSEHSRVLRERSDDGEDSGNSKDSLKMDRDSCGESGSDRSSEAFGAEIPEYNLLIRTEPSGTPPSTSSSSSSDDLFQVIPAEVIKSTGKIHSANKLVGVNSPTGKVDLSSDSSACPASTSPISDLTHETIILGMSPTQSPPVQVMDRSGAYDPFRIPSAVFARSKSTAPVDWSIASNESLFSIQLGNSSLSREQINNLWGGDLLLKSDDVLLSSDPTFNPSIPEEAVDDKIDHGERNPKSVGLTMDVDNETKDHKNKEQKATQVTNLNSARNSDESGTSGISFSFPIKKKSECRKSRTQWLGKIFLCRRKMCAWPSCYCSNCSWAFCYCKRPCCSCKWPSCCSKRPSCCCSTCSWAFCYTWNCRRKRICCSPSTTLTTVDPGSPIRSEVKQHHQQTFQPQCQEPCREEPDAIVISKNPSSCCSCFSCSSSCSCTSCFSCGSCCSSRSCCSCNCSYSCFSCCSQRRRCSRCC